MILQQSDFTDRDVAECDSSAFAPYLTEVDYFYTDFCLRNGLTGQKLPIDFSCKRLCVLFVLKRFFSDRLGLNLREVQDGVVDHYAVKLKNVNDEYANAYSQATDSLVDGNGTNNIEGGTIFSHLNFGI